MHIILILLLLLTACSEEKPKGGFGGFVPYVNVAAARAETVPYIVESIDNTEPYRTVEVRPQISGKILKVHFEDGSEIKKGEPLYTIDSSPYKAVLEEAQGQFTKAQADLSYKKSRVERYKELLPENYVSLLDYQQFVSEESAAEGALQHFAGSLDKAKVDVKWCTIRAPLAGKLSYTTRDEGNIVSPIDKDCLVTINEISPIYAAFNLPEKEFPLIQEYNTNGDLKVDVSVIGQKIVHSGKLTFVNNSLNQKSGTIFLRATLPNVDLKLWPGQYLHVKIHLYDIPNAVLIPARAIRNDTQGAYVFVAKEDNTVEMRRVVLGQIQELTPETEQVVLEGVAAGENVVTEGQLALYPGSKYQLKTKS